MIDLSKERLPNTIEVRGAHIPIRTGFRFALAALRLIKAGEYTLCLSLMLRGAVPARASDEEVLQALMLFLQPKDELPRPSPSDDNSTKFIDFDIDAGMIAAAFWQCYGVRLTDEKCDLHWWEFLSLLHGITGTALNNIIELRGWQPAKGDSEEYKRKMAERRSAWELRAEPTAEEKAEAQAFYALLE